MRKAIAGVASPVCHEEPAVRQAEEGQHGRHARLQLCQESRCGYSHTEHEFFDRLNVEKGFCKRLRIPAGVSSVRENLPATLSLQDLQSRLERFSIVLNGG